MRFPYEGPPRVGFGALTRERRSCMHRAVVDFSPHERYMRRVTVQGDEPYYSPTAGAVRASKL